MRIRPVFHSSDAAIRGHVFLFVPRPFHAEIPGRLSREAGIVPEWNALLRDLDRLQHVRIHHRGDDWSVRYGTVSLLEFH